MSSANKNQASSAANHSWWSLPKNLLRPFFSGWSKNYKDLWRNFFSMMIIGVLGFIGLPLQAFGSVLTWWLNFYRINGGSMIKIIVKLPLGGLEIPGIGVGSKSHYYSMIGCLDPRVDLTNPHSDDFCDFKSRDCAELCIMSAKLAYESQDIQEYVLKERWNMCFRRFYDCYNGRARRNTTQAFMFTDKPKDASLAVLAFRGTEPFDSHDWSIDCDFGWVEPDPNVGSIHSGFLEALGIIESRLNSQSLEKFKQKGLPTAPPGKYYAYKTIIQDLGDLLIENPNAKLVITGHSLGGALAIIFAGAIMYMGSQGEREKKILESLGAIYTFGQPRVGDPKFAEYTTRNLEYNNVEYHRVVYGYDLVPRIPFDDEIFRFRHCGRMCNYFRTSYIQQGLREEPNANYFDFVFGMTTRIAAIGELWNGTFYNRLKHGDSFAETRLMFIARLLALLAPGLTAHCPTNYVNAVQLGPEHLSTTITN